jgi:spermidine/putrescine transport system ATP-binding protein
VDRTIDLSVDNISKAFGDFTAVDNISFDVEDGKFFSILGPSGCGKTTLLRMIAGFQNPSSGTIKIGGKDMARVEPNQRPVSLIFQNLALFPMMNVKENVAFGLKRRGERGKAVYLKVEEMLARVGLAGFGKRKIEQLSGGQKQRVAIARSLILNPTVLLLDEPLGALDLKLREHMKVELKKLQAQVGTTFVYITHDQSEAMVMSDYVAVMNQGRFEQVDTPPNLYRNPATSFVAQFVGDNNQFSGVHKTSQEKSFIETEDRVRFWTKPKNGIKDNKRVEMYIRPEAIIINPPEDDGLNRIAATVKAILFDGANSRLLVSIGEQKKELLVSLPQNGQYDTIKVKDNIHIGWDPSSSVCFEETGVKTHEELE